MTISSLHDLKFNFTPINQIADIEFSPLMLAAKLGDCGKMELLLNQIENVNQTSIQDAFCLAAMSGHEKLIVLMIRKGVDPNFSKREYSFRDYWQEGLTPMGHAIYNRQGAVIAALLKNGAKIEDVSRIERDSDSALDLFFSKHSGENNPAMLQLILAAGAKVHSLHPLQFSGLLYMQTAMN